MPRVMEAILVERFFFDLTDGPNTISDVDDVLAADLSDAIAQAEVLIMELRIIDEQIDAYEAWMLIVRDAAGDKLTTLPVAPPT